jgi:hemerythrin-like domain-containing protein
MKPTEILTHEHRVIEQVLSCLLALSHRAESHGSLDREAASGAIEFLRGYADRWHHGKEEERLFPLMEARGLSPNEGPTAVMRVEHAQGRRHIDAMNGAIDAAARGDAAALERFVGQARAYVVLLREHIEKEDHCLFPMAEQVLSEEDHRRLLVEFEDAVSSERGPDRGGSSRWPTRSCSGWAEQRSRPHSGPAAA